MPFVTPLFDADLVPTWNGAWAELGLSSPLPLRLQLQMAWGETHRHYHSLQHLRECMAFWVQWRQQAVRPAEVALALWFHDAVYDPTSGDNELKSASWAARAMMAAGAKEEEAQRVYELIMATRHGSVGAASGDMDTELLLDIDLAILGAPPARFAVYDNDIRAEYAAVPERRYKEVRRSVLLGFLERPRLYRTEVARQALETQARRNVAGAIEHLAQ